MAKHSTPSRAARAEEELEEEPIAVWRRVSKFRPKRLRQKPRPQLSVSQILAWADLEFQRTDRWPQCASGPVLADLNEKWRNIDAALRQGARGLPGSSSLPQLLCEERGVRIHGRPPSVTETQIITWAKAHHRRMGSWPTADSGPVAGVPDEKWDNLDQMLREGGRGLPGGFTLARLLARECGHRNKADLPQLTEHKIAQWARAHRERTGKWPVPKAGPVFDAPGETWHNLNRSLRNGERGLPGGDSLGKLIARRFGARNWTNIPTLTVKKILAWADDHRARTGRWPIVAAGPVRCAPGETWLAIDSALREGLRGLHAGSSLAQLLNQYRGARNKAKAPRLTPSQILAWADLHFKRTGTWPTQSSGSVRGARGETWGAIQSALLEGLRGLSGGDTIRKFLIRSGWMKV